MRSNAVGRASGGGIGSLVPPLVVGGALPFLDDVYVYVYAYVHVHVHVHGYMYMYMYT